MHTSRSEPLRQLCDNSDEALLLDWWPKLSRSRSIGTVHIIIPTSSKQAILLFKKITFVIVWMRIAAAIVFEFLELSWYCFGGEVEFLGGGVSLEGVYYQAWAVILIVWFNSCLLSASCLCWKVWALSFLLLLPLPCKLLAVMLSFHDGNHDPK